MERTEPIKKSWVIEDLHHLQLMALLRELVRKRGFKDTARELGLDPRTITSSIRAGRLSPKTRWALEKALQYGAGSAAAEQRERNDKLEDRLGKLEGQLRELKKELQGGLKRLRMSLDGVRKYYAVQRRLIDQRLLVLESGHDGSETGTDERYESGTSSMSSGPRPGRPDDLKEQPPAGMTELVSERRQALTSLLTAEERLRAGMDPGAWPPVDPDDRVEAPTETGIAEPVKMSRRRRTRSWARRRTPATSEK